MILTGTVYARFTLVSVSNFVKKYVVILSIILRERVPYVEPPVRASSFVLRSEGQLQPLQRQSG